MKANSNRCVTHIQSHGCMYMAYMQSLNEKKNNLNSVVQPAVLHSLNTGKQIKIRQASRLLFEKRKNAHSTYSIK
jgi:hypothetical protein